MTTETNQDDRHISDAYRGIATEKTPPELDRKVLAMAAGGSRSRYGSARAWIRPAAWAATIGLSLAFVLEMSQVDDAASPPARTDSAEPVEERIARPEAPAPAAESIREQPQAAGPAVDGATVSGDFEAADMDMLREAENQARARAGSEQDTPVKAEAHSFDAAATLEKKAQVRHCDRDARSTAANWYTCIRELKESGLTEAADQELAALLTRFPDFEAPGQDK